MLQDSRQVVYVVWYYLPERSRVIKRIFRTEEGAKEFVKNRPEEYNIENHFVEDQDTGVSKTDSRVFEEDIQTRPTGEHFPKEPNAPDSRGETVEGTMGKDT